MDFKTHSSSSFMTWRDPTHKRGLNLSTFTYFDRSTSEGELFSYYGGVDFRTVYGELLHKVLAADPAQILGTAPGKDLGFL